MKLARIVHIHCHQRELREPETYVWVDDAMTLEEFTAFVVLAQAAYDKAGRDFNEAVPPPFISWGQPDYKKYPDKTVAEVQAAHDAALAKHKAWSQQKAEAQANFAHHLKLVSGDRILLFRERKSAFDHILDWGHRHGQKIAHGETVVNDLQGLAVKDDDWL